MTTAERKLELLADILECDFQCEAGPLTGLVQFKELQQLLIEDNAAEKLNELNKHPVNVSMTMPELERPICFIDLETTGVDVDKDFIVEISVLKVMPDQTQEIRTMLINPGVPIPAGATEVHGITNEDVAGCPTFASISKSLKIFIDNCDIAGFNSNTFDVPMLNAMFNRVGLVWEWKKVNLIDVRNIFVQQEERTLSAAVKFYLGREHDAAHSAEGDIKETMNVFLAQLARYPDLPKDMNGLAWYSNYSEEIIDLARKFKKDDAGEIVFNFGSHKGEVARKNKNYLKWMIDKGDFSKDTKSVANLLSFQ